MINIIPPPSTSSELSAFLEISPGDSSPDQDWSEFSSHLNSDISLGTSTTGSLLDSLDQSKVSLERALEVVAAHPSGRNVFDATRHLSEFDLKTLVIGKVVDKATKGIDRMMNMQ